MKQYLVAYNGMDTGLGNRIRVVLSSQILAEQEGRQLLYVWPTGAKFGPRFTDLFDFQGGRPLPRSASRLLGKRYAYRDHSLEWMTAAARGERVWQVRTGAPLSLPPGSPTWGERLRSLPPVADVAARVEDFFDRELRGERYVGVMIRAHQVSHAETKKASPVEWFIERMQAIRADWPDTRFFVCCDVPEVQAHVFKTVGGCVGQDDKGAYNSTPGVKSSVVDLYLLAGANHLVAPHYSSFIHMAQHLGGDAISIQTSRTPRVDHVDLEQLPLADSPLTPWRRDRSTSTAG